jgi:hypothetical protein
VTAVPAEATVRIDAGHSLTESPAEAPSITVATVAPAIVAPAIVAPAAVAPAAIAPAIVAPAVVTPAFIAPQSAEPWSWPPIVQRLLTCPAAADLRNVAVKLRELAAGHDLRCVAFSGPGRGVGRTSLVLTLASVLIADKTTRVTIFDGDFDHPDAAQLISLHPTVGLEEAIQNATAAKEAATTLIAGRLAIVPLAKPVTAESIDNRRSGDLQTLLRSLRRENDIVLIDAGPWETGRLPLVLECRAVDAVVCVCRANSSGAVTPDAGSFRQPGVEWLGVVETFAQSGSRHNGSGRVNNV